MRWSYPSAVSIRSSPFSPAFLRSKTYGSMARNALFDAHRTQVDKSATIVVKKRHTHNNLLLTDAGRRVLALSPTQPGAPVSGSESGSSMPSAASNAWPPSPNPIETTPPRWKTNSCWSPVAYRIFTSNAPTKKTTRGSASIHYYHATTLIFNFIKNVQTIVN